MSVFAYVYMYNICLCTHVCTRECMYVRVGHMLIKLQTIPPLKYDA